VRQKITFIFLVIIILIEITTIGVIIYFQLIPKLTTPQTIKTQATSEEKKQEPTATLDNKFAECLQKIQLPSPNLIPGKIANYERVTTEIPDINQWPSMKTGNPIQVKSGAASRYTSDPKVSFDLELTITEYLEDKKEEFDYYKKLVEDKSFLESETNPDQANVSNAGLYTQKELGGLKYLLSQEPGGGLYEGNSSVITIIPERNLLIAFDFQKHETKAEEIFKTWLDLVCP